MNATFLLALTLAASNGPEGVRQLQYDLPVDLALTASGAALWIVSDSVLKKELAPPDCRWCERGPDGSDRRIGLDLLGTQLKWADEHVGAMDAASNVLAFGLMPAAVFGSHALVARSDDALAALPIDFLIIAEAMVASAVLNQAVKFSVGRSRPFVFRLGQDNDLVEHPEDNNLSFYSGHSAWAFAMVGATATVAELRGYRRAAWIWWVGLPLAVAMPIMRMAADKHYLTDVLVGSAVGLGIGVGLPRLFHAPVEGVQLRAYASPGGAGVQGRF